MNEFTESERIPVVFTHFGSFFAIALGESRITPYAVTLLSYLLILDGVFVRPGDKGGFLTTAHETEDVEKLIRAFEHGLQTLRGARLLPA